jgi:peptide/nickel transport system substrate-binding protein
MKKIDVNSRARTSLAVLLVMIIGITMLCGCQNQSRDQATIHIGIRKDIESMDPAVFGRGGPDPQRYLIYEPLLYMDENFEIKGRLAESWEATPDGKVWTLQLKKGVKFSDGASFNAQAVKFSVEYLLQNKRLTLPLEAVETPGEHTVKLIFTQPYATLPSQLTTIEIFSPTAFDSDGKFKTPIGTGPFLFEEWKKGQELIFSRNDQYWGKKPKEEQVVFEVIPDHQTRVMALETGQIAVADYLPVASIADMGKKGGYSVYKKASPCMNWIGFNTYREPFNDPLVRRAVIHAIDIQRIIKSVVGDVAIPSLQGPLSSPVHDAIRDPDINWYGYDLDEARRLLAEAGWKDSGKDGILERNGKPFTVTLISSTLYEEGKALSEAIQAELRKIGIDVEIQVLESGARFEALNKRNYELIELGGICATNDPTSWFEYYFGTKHPEYCVLHDVRLEHLINQLYETVDPEKRKEIFYNLQQLLKEQAAGIFLYSQQGITVTTKGVKNFYQEGGMPGTYSYLRTISLK